MSGSLWWLPSDHDHYDDFHLIMVTMMTSIWSWSPTISSKSDIIHKNPFLSVQKHQTFAFISISSQFNKCDHLPQQQTSSKLFIARSSGVLWDFFTLLSCPRDDGIVGVRGSCGGSRSVLWLCLGDLCSESRVVDWWESRSWIAWNLSMGLSWMEGIKGWDRCPTGCPPYGSDGAGNW